MLDAVGNTYEGFGVVIPSFDSCEVSHRRSVSMRAKKLGPAEPVELRGGAEYSRRIG